MIAPIYEERLRQMGSWLAVNGEAIYASKPWKHQNDTVTSYVWLELFLVPSLHSFVIAGRRICVRQLSHSLYHWIICHKTCLHLATQLYSPIINVLA